MKITYTPDLENYLQYQLYKYSLSRQYKIQRGSLYLFLIFFFLFGVALVWPHDYGWPVYLILAVVCLILCPIYHRWNIKRQYRKYIKKALLAKTKETIVLEIIKDSLAVKIENVENSVPISNIRQITEITGCYFIEQDAFSSFILPKNLETKQFVQVLTEKYGVKLVQNLRWKW